MRSPCLACLMVALTLGCVTETHPGQQAPLGSEPTSGGNASVGGGGAGGLAAAAGSGGGLPQAGTGGAAAGAAGSAVGGGGGAPDVPVDSPICRPAFSSGVNVAWNDFARDIPNPDMDFFNQLFSDVSVSGGNAVRWWFHTNGSRTPTFDGDGFAQPLAALEIDGVKQLLDAAQTQGLQLIISLWSFDMQQAEQWEMTEAKLENNRRLLQEDSYRQAYIDNVLVPLVTAVKGHPALHSWEIFNEPEGMTNEFGWASQRVNMADIQKTVNWFADAIHGADSGAWVTSGSWSFKASSDADGNYDYYRDDRLIEVGGRAKGTLDYAQVHYYNHFGEGFSPFAQPASHWGIQKPLVIGEFFPEDTFGVSTADLYSKVYENGYAGAWSWQYIEFWSDMVAPMQKLASEHAADLSCL